MQFWQHGEKLSARGPNILSSSPILFMEIFVFFFETFFIYFTGTRRLQFWQQRRFFFVETPKFFCSKHETESRSFFFSKKVFFSKRSSRHVKCGLDNCADQFFQRSHCSWLKLREKRQISFSSQVHFFPKTFFWIRRVQLRQHFQKNSQQRSKIIFLNVQYYSWNYDFFQKKPFLSKIFWTSNVHFWQSCWSFLREVQIFPAQFLKKFAKKFFRQKKISWNFLWPPRVQFDSCAKSFFEKSKNFHWGSGKVWKKCFWIYSPIFSGDVYFNFHSLAENCMKMSATFCSKYKKFHLKIHFSQKVFENIPLDT